MSSLFQFWGKTSRPEYADGAQFFEALRREEAAAIRHLGGKAAGAVAAVGRANGLSQPDIEELLGDAVAVFVEKVRDGRYLYEGHSPVTYVVECSKKLAQTRARSRSRKPVEAMPEGFERADADFFYATYENAQFVGAALDRLGRPCSDVVRWHYLDGLTDRAVIEWGGSSFKNEGSLKTRRGQCLKLLGKLITEGLFR